MFLTLNNNYTWPLILNFYQLIATNRVFIDQYIINNFYHYPKVKVRWLTFALLRLNTFSNFKYYKLIHINSW